MWWHKIVVNQQNHFKMGGKSIQMCTFVIYPQINCTKALHEFQ